MNNIIFILLSVLWVGTNAQGVQRWSRTYDDLQGPNGIGSIVVNEDSSYVFVSQSFFTLPARLRWSSVNLLGDTTSTTLHLDSSAVFQGGGSHSTERRDDGTILYTGGRIPLNGDEPNGLLVCFDMNGDTCWYKEYGTEANEGLNGLCLTSDGGAAMAGYRQTNQSNVWVVRVDMNGDTLWTGSYGGGGTENGVSIRNTIDGGFIISGFKILSGNNYDMYLVKIDADGNFQWQENYGSPWIDNWGFVEQLPDGRLIMAGAERLSANSNKRPALYLLDENGNEIWSVIHDDEPDRSVFITIPVLLEDGGFAIAGDRNFGNITHGMLTRTDNTGQIIWRRLFQTIANHDQYFYDVRRTLDGGFIMAGTAFDSLEISQDAWLVKVDSFGCLLPGCQIFDGLEEQFTDLSAALSIAPNPANYSTQITFELPQNFKLKGPIELSLISTDGRLVYQESLQKQHSFSHSLDLGGLARGVYFVHLRDGNRWLAGKKLVVQ